MTCKRSGYLRIVRYHAGALFRMCLRQGTFVIWSFNFSLLQQHGIATPCSASIQHCFSICEVVPKWLGPYLIFQEMRTNSVLARLLWHFMVEGASPKWFWCFEAEKAVCNDSFTLSGQVSCFFRGSAMNGSAMHMPMPFTWNCTTCTYASTFLNMSSSRLYVKIACKLSIIPSGQDLDIALLIALATPLF